MQYKIYLKFRTPIFNIMKTEWLKGTCIFFYTISVYLYDFDGLKTSIFVVSFFSWKMTHLKKRTNPFSISKLPHLYGVNLFLKFIFEFFFRIFFWNLLLLLFFFLEFKKKILELLIFFFIILFYFLYVYIFIYLFFSILATRAKMFTGG